MSDPEDILDPSGDDFFETIRRDYAELGLLEHVDVGKNLSSLVVSPEERLDPSPTPDERTFWGSPLGIDGWQPEFTRHHYPAWLIDSAAADYAEEEEDIERSDAMLDLLGPVEDAEMPSWRFYATNLTKNESVRMHHRVRNLCPAKELMTIAKNCNQSPEGQASPKHCWRENSLFIKCNEFKKQYLNNRQRLIYIYGSIRDDFRDWNEEDELDPEPGELSEEHLYVFRWEFYRLQYKEAKRNQYIRQMNAYKEHRQISFWQRLMNPSTWFSPSVPAPHAPKHTKNYLFQGHHWLAPEDVKCGLPMTPEQYSRSFFAQRFTEADMEDLRDG